MQLPAFRFAVYSLAFLWLFTGIASLWLGRDIGYEILDAAEIHGIFADVSLVGGAILDIAIGFWLLTRWNLKLCYLVQLSLMAVYTLLLSILEPSYWFHPFGPVTKNIPIAALVILLYVQEPQNLASSTSEKS